MNEKQAQGLRDLEDMARDARRYRKLRECHWEDLGIVVVENSQDLQLGTQTLSGVRLDKAIDRLPEVKY